MRLTERRRCHRPGGAPAGSHGPAASVLAMEDVIWSDRPDSLDRPVLVAAFEGWNDAGDAATTALATLADLADAQMIATIDPEPFTDFAVNRPSVRLDGEGRRSIEWPATTIRLGRLPEDGRHLVIVEGSEPRLRWRRFCRAVLDVAADLEIELVVTIGALLADVVHTDPVGVIGSALDPAVVERLGLRPSTYEGPTGIVGILQQEARESGIESVSLWAPVPAYVSAAPSPKAALALVERAASLLDARPDLTRLRAAATGYSRQVDELVAEDPDLQEYVARIREAEASEPLTDDPARSSSELMVELEQYLRDQGES